MAEPATSSTQPGGAAYLSRSCGPTAPSANNEPEAAVTDQGKAAEISVAVELAQEILRLRTEAGLSQRILAGRICYSRQYIQAAERTDGVLPSPSLVRAIDDGLGANGRLTALRDRAVNDQKKRRRALAKQRSAPHQDAVRSESLHQSGKATGTIATQLRQLRRVLDAHDLPEDGPVRPHDQLQRAVADLVDKRLRSDYIALASQVPQLLSEVHRARATSTDRLPAARLLVQVYRAADAIADKFGHYDLSARIIDLLRQAAAETEDHLLVATAAYVRGEVFFANGDLGTGARLLERAANAISPGLSTTARATYGSLHMRAAVMSARAGRATGAADHIAEASSVAQGLNEGIHLGTAFGAASVRIHQVSLAVELGDVGAALRHAAGWKPPLSLPAERRSHHYIELGRAFYQADRPNDVLSEGYSAGCIEVQSDYG